MHKVFSLSLRSSTSYASSPISSLSSSFPPRAFYSHAPHSAGRCLATRAHNLEASLRGRTPSPLPQPQPHPHSQSQPLPSSKPQSQLHAKFSGNTDRIRAKVLKNEIPLPRSRSRSRFEIRDERNRDGYVEIERRNRARDSRRWTSSHKNLNSFSSRNDNKFKEKEKDLDSFTASGYDYPKPRVRHEGKQQQQQHNSEKKRFKTGTKTTTMSLGSPSSPSPSKSSSSSSWDKPNTRLHNGHGHGHVFTTKHEEGGVDRRRDDKEEEGDEREYQDRRMRWRKENININTMGGKILYEDRNTVVVYKPPEATIQGEKHTIGSKIWNRIVRQTEKKTGCLKLFPVHRLDKGVSGPLILSKSSRQASEFRVQFQQSSNSNSKSKSKSQQTSSSEVGSFESESEFGIGKSYFAIVVGKIPTTTISTTMNNSIQDSHGYTDHGEVEFEPESESQPRLTAKEIEVGPERERWYEIDSALVRREEGMGIANINSNSNDSNGATASHGGKISTMQDDGEKSESDANGMVKGKGTRGGKGKIVEKVMNAVTRFRVISSNDNYSLLQLFPKTGRKHQLRIHLSSLGSIVCLPPPSPSFESSQLRSLTPDSSASSTSSTSSSSSSLVTLNHPPIIMGDFKYSPKPIPHDLLRKHLVILNSSSDNGGSNNYNFGLKKDNDDENGITSGLNGNRNGTWDGRIMLHCGEISWFVWRKDKNKDKNQTMGQEGQESLSLSPEKPLDGRVEEEEGSRSEEENKVTDKDHDPSSSSLLNDLEEMKSRPLTSTSNSSKAKAKAKARRERVVVRVPLPMDFRSVMKKVGLEIPDGY